MHNNGNDSRCNEVHSKKYNAKMDFKGALRHHSPQRVFPALTKGGKYSNPEKRNMLESTMAYFHLCRSGHSSRIESGKRAAEKKLSSKLFFLKLNQAYRRLIASGDPQKKGLSRGLYTFRGESGGHFFYPLPCAVFLILLWSVFRRPLQKRPSRSLPPSLGFCLLCQYTQSFGTPSSPLAAR